MFEVTRMFHGAIFDGMMSIGKIYAGDMVFWHPDVVHGLEPDHTGARGGDWLVP